MGPQRRPPAVTAPSFRGHISIQTPALTQTAALPAGASQVPCPDSSSPSAPARVLSSHPHPWPWVSWQGTPPLCHLTPCQFGSPHRQASQPSSRGQVPAGRSARSRDSTPCALCPGAFPWVIHLSLIHLLDNWQQTELGSIPGSPRTHCDLRQMTSTLQISLSFPLCRMGYQHRLPGPSPVWSVLHIVVSVPPHGPTRKSPSLPLRAREKQTAWDHTAL